MYKKILAISSLALLLGACGYATTPASTSTSNQSQAGTAVSIQGFAFGPASLAVNVGDTVTWTNNDSTSHTVTGSGWGSATLAPGQSYTYTFSQAGTYPYKCSIHPTMLGTVVAK